MRFTVSGLTLMALMALIAFAMPAVAHHSFAMFDANKTMTVEGNVKEFHWTNPHSWIFLMVPNAQGQTEEWPIELGSPSGLIRQGWVPKTLTAGMKVKVLIRPLKDGKAGGQFLQVTLPDGKTLGDPSTRGNGPATNREQP
jgi:Family of unknown function (DUF6152)